MGSCCSCSKKNIDLQDILIENASPPLPNGVEDNIDKKPINKIIVQSNSVTNTIVAFVDVDAVNKKTDFKKFPFLKNNLIEINSRKDLFKMPPIGTIHDEDNIYSLALFGDTDTGKTTFFNQFRLYIDDFSPSERKSYTLRIYVTILEAIQKVYNEVKNKDKFANFENEDLIQELNDIKINELRKTYSVPLDFCDKVISVWNDPLISKAYSEQWIPLHLCQYVPDFISKISKFKAANYVPENTEILRTKICTINNNIHNRISDDLLSSSALSTSPQMCALSFCEMELLLRDAGGLKSQRDKWKNFTFDAGFFFVSLADFNQPVLNDGDSNQSNKTSNDNTEENDEKNDQNLQIFESLKIFKDIIPKFFPGPQKPLFVLLTKYDSFIDIISKDPKCFTNVFPDFDGNITDPDQCQKYIGNLFAKHAKSINPDLKLKICTSINCLDQISVFQVTKKIVKQIKKYRV